MFEPLLARLSNTYHLVAPDYPGFGHSDAPGSKEFSYTFDHVAQVMQRFTDVLGLGHYILYMQDYGGPVGLRLAIAHPERVQGLIIQNAVTHEEGLSPLWQKRREFWADRAANEAGLRANFSSLAATRQRHIGSNPNPRRSTDRSATTWSYFVSLGVGLASGAVAATSGCKWGLLHEANNTGG